MLWERWEGEMPQHPPGKGNLLGPLVMWQQQQP